MQLNPYLFFKGNCADAFRFYERCFGGKIVTMMTHEGTPAENDVPPEWRKKIIHARMTVGDTTLMGSDAPPGRQADTAGFSVSLIVNSASEAERIFKELCSGGEVRMPMQQTFFAERFGMVVDRFGTPWMINCEMQAEPSR